MISGKNQIGYTEKSNGETTFKTFNPELNHENEWNFFEATADEIEEAIQLATAAFVDFRQKSDRDRAKFLRQIADNMEALGDQLLEVYQLESGLPISRAKVERTRTVSQLRMFADLIETKDWRRQRIEEAILDRTPNPKPDLRKTYLPLGPIAVFGASNFPFAYSTAGGDTASALAAGCPVIVKSHPMHAGTGNMVAQAIAAAGKQTGMPDGVFSNLNSKGIEVGSALVSHAGIKAVGFTGSISGGRALMDLAAKRSEPIPVFAEMGSINPVVISPKSLINKEEWAKKYAISITSGTGQFCTNPGLLLGIDSPKFDAFIKLLSQSIQDESSTVMLHPGIHTAFLNKRAAALSQQGVQLMTSEVRQKPNYGMQTLATVDGITFLQNRLLHQEVFGPYSLVVKCSNAEELRQIISQIEGQLTGTLIVTEDEYQWAKPILKALETRVGRVIFNGVPTGVEVTAAMTHGGPYPASSDARFTAVGADAIFRWLRPVTYQNAPQSLVPDELCAK